MLVAYAKIIVLQGVSVFTGLLVSWQVSLRVEPTALGQYSLYLSLIGAAGILFVNWPNAALLRFGREEWSRHNRLGENLATRGASYLAGGGLAVALAWMLDPLVVRFLNVRTDPFPWLALGILLVPLGEMGIYANQATGNSLPYGYVPLVGGATVLLGVLLIPLMAPHPGWDYLVAWMLGGAVAAAIAAFWSFPRRAWHGFRPRRSTLARILRYSWSFPFGGLAALTVNWVDAWVIRFYLGNDAVGLYTWAYRVTAIGGLAFSPLVGVLTPGMVDARLAGDLDRVSRHGHRSLGVVVLVGMAGIVLLAAVFPLMALAVGPRYHAAYPVILILLSAIPFQMLGYLMNPVGNAYEFLMLRGVAVSFWVAGANVVGDLVLVPWMGVLGAALTTGAIFSLAGLLLARLMIRHIPGLQFPTLRRFAAGGLPMPLAALCLWAAGPAWGAALCGGVLIVAAWAARRAGLFSWDDAEWLERQPIAARIKRPLVLVARWFAGGQGLAGT